MLRPARTPATLVYPVEVSGWDSRQGFFVETCDLVWNEGSGKQVALKQALRENAILFVRLLQGGEADRSHPVAYEAKFMGKTQSGLKQFSLHTVVPRLKEQESSVA